MDKQQFLQNNKSYESATKFATIPSMYIDQPEWWVFSKGRMKDPGKAPKSQLYQNQWMKDDQEER